MSWTRQQYRQYIALQQDHINKLESQVENLETQIKNLDDQLEAKDKEIKVAMNSWKNAIAQKQQPKAVKGEGIFKIFGGKTKAK